MQDGQETPDYYSVRAGSYEDTHTVLRFPGTEHGKLRAAEYAEAYNESLRKAMGLTKLDLTVESPDFTNRPHEYDLAEKVDAYRGESAMVTPRYGIPIVGDDDPMPTDYPHDH